MDVKEAIKKRRAYRILEPIALSDQIFKELGKAAQLTPSCFNNQPWRFIFVSDKNVLKKMFIALSEGNAWAKQASFIIVLFGKKENDCVIKQREYYLFDMGMAAFAIILRATELGLTAHPIAGFSPEKVKQILKIPENNMVIILLIVGKKVNQLKGKYSEKQIQAEEKRPERRKLSQIYSMDKYNNELKT